jgi:hypothetical protein
MKVGEEKYRNQKRECILNSDAITPEPRRSTPSVLPPMGGQKVNVNGCLRLLNTHVVQAPLPHLAGLGIHSSF